VTPTFPAKAAVAVVAVGLVLTACGGDSDGEAETDGQSAGGLASDTGTINIEMRDNEFAPDRIEVSEGETVRLVFRNRGSVTHDAVIGDEAAQQAHEMEMREAEETGDDGMGDMEHGTESETSDDGGMAHGTDGGGSEESAITVEPGEQGELSYTFTAGDDVLIGCHEEGHYADGMRITVDVT
jgi:uncharacterized cupredoxin-like copper-binding protein